MKMKRRVKSYVMAAVAALGLASSANAAALDGVTVSLNFTEMPVPGATNLTRYVVSVHREGTAPNMAGLDLVFTAQDGDLFELWPSYAGGAPAASNLSVFSDSVNPIFLNPAFIPVFFPSFAAQGATGPGPVTTLHDTQWLFPSSGVLGIAANNTESQTTLKGTFAVTGSTPTAAQDWVIASIVRRTDGLHMAAGLPDGDWTKLAYSGKIGFVGGGEATVSGLFDAAPPTRGRTGVEDLGTDGVDGSLDGNPSSTGGFDEFVYDDPTSEGRVGINNWSSQAGIYNVYLDVNLNDGKTLDDLLEQLNGDLDGTNGQASALPQGVVTLEYLLLGYDIVISYNGFPVPGGMDGGSAAFEFDLGDVGAVSRVAVPVPAAGWAGLALLGGMGLRRARKSS